MTPYQNKILFALRERHDKGRPKPPCTPHGVVGTVGSPQAAGRALAELARQGMVQDVGSEAPLYTLTEKGTTFTN